MPRILTAVSVALTVGLAAALAGSAPSARPDPEPKVIKAGAADMSKPVPPPSDATVLFDGSNLDAWQTADGKGGAAPWTVAGGAATINGKGSIITKQKFGDAQIHVEFATPTDLHGESQERGNSGVYVQGRYELQVLDSFNNKTYPNGQCGAIYGQHPPLVNACRAPGEWQTYDIVFHAAKFDAAGKKTANARMTAFHNGVLVQDNAEITGTTGSAPNGEGAEAGYLYLQDHGNPVKYRNIWIRPL